MSEFLEVFLDDLQKIHPRREIDIKKEIIVDTQPIYIFPYKMDTIELKDNLKALLAKGFIGHSVLH